jgi:hypothetical protein
MIAAVTFAFRFEQQCQASAFSEEKHAGPREKVSAKQTPFGNKCIFSCNEIVAENLDRDTPKTLLSLMLRISAARATTFLHLNQMAALDPLKMRASQYTRCNRYHDSKTDVGK